MLPVSLPLCQGRQTASQWASRRFHERPPASTRSTPLRAFQELLDRYGYHSTKYGHFGDGCIHCRINFDLRTAQGLKRWRSFLDEAADLVVEQGGSLSGEHGDGQSRAELLEKMYGPDLLKAFRQLKAIWDPDGRMNPGKVVDPYPIVSNLRLGTGYRPTEPQTHFSYSEDRGSFAHATLRCVGAGLCRDTESGTMCPSYMVTRDEQHTTRGRARILYEMLQGEVITDGFRSKEVHEALDLCLACKGCKGDCPVNVDMATYKAEFLSKHYKRRLRPPAAYSMGLVMFWARLASRMPRLANTATRIPLLGRLLKRIAGISPRREAPAFARETFRSWFRDRASANPNGPPVVLFPDTFNEHLHPGVAKSATRVLEAAGFRVIVPDGFLCCGRPLYDYGMLDTAKLLLRRLVRRLAPYARNGAPIVGLEPSCVAALRDELPGMLVHDEDAIRIAESAMTLAEFLQEHAADWEIPRLERRAIVHGHCHQEAIMGMDSDRELLDRLGLDHEVLDSGCCGMAGSFGFEADKYDISVAIGERRLLPAVREAPEDALIVADGFSCRTQIEQLTERRAIHTAEAIELALQHGSRGPATRVPEDAREAPH